MSSNHTENFGLSQWLPTDGFMREDFNADNAAVDEALSTCLRAMTGSYAGTGVYGTANPNTLTFGHTPKVVVIQCMGAAYTGACVFIWGAENPLMITTNNNGTTGVYALQASYSGNTVSWYSSSGALYQLNRSGSTYNYATLY